VRPTPFAGFDHIDLRVRSIAAARPLYDALMPALGLVEIAVTDTVSYYEPVHAPGSARRFFELNEDPGHAANAIRIAFRAESAADVDRLAEVARAAGAHIIEGPEIVGYATDDTYYAVFFEDASGNRLEIVYRKPHRETAAQELSAT
jgi:catechol 2,3-dioxygenase-like lactoylglutathione lyase family enzyme